MKDRFSSLDGWRGLAILFVLAGHLLPLGPKAWQMNAAIAATGMVVFFNLSGFLITTILLYDQNVISFLVRRFMRIVPLAWLVLLVTFFSVGPGWNLLLPHFLFYANWGGMALTPATSHFWSLCVEVQFYVSIALLVSFIGKKAFFVIPVLSIAFTILRWHDGVGIAINTYYRVDEILAGCTLALLYNRNHGTVSRLFCVLNPVVIFPLVLLSAHPHGGILQYFRPYFSVMMIGSALFNDKEYWWSCWLKSRFLFYVATISYALYVSHGGLRYTWLAEGDTLERYVKRPLFLAVTFLLAHVSTFYYEKYWIDLGKKIGARVNKVTGRP